MDRVLDCDFDFDSSGVGFSPDKRSIHDAYFLKTSQFLKTQSEQLSGLGGGDNPAGRRRQPSVAITAELKVGFALDSGGNIDRELDTVKAEGAGRLRSIDGGTAVATQDTASWEKSFVSGGVHAGWATTGEAAALEDGKTYVAVFCCMPTGAMDTGASSRSIDIFGRVVLKRKMSVVKMSTSGFGGDSLCKYLV